MKAAFLLLGLLGTFGVGMMAGRMGMGTVRRSTTYRLPVEEAPSLQKPAAGHSSTPPIARGSKAGLDVLEAISSIPIVRIEEGTNAISGRVRAETGEAIPGVLVYAVHAQPDDQPGERWSDLRPRPVSVEEADFRSRVLAVIEKERIREAGRHVATTGENGIFMLTGLADTMYRVQGRAEGFEIEPRDAKAGSGGMAFHFTSRRR